MDSARSKKVIWPKSDVQVNRALKNEVQLHMDSILCLFKVWLTPQNDTSLLDFQQILNVKKTFYSITGN